MENEKVIKKVEEMLKIASDFTRLKIMTSLLDDSKCTCTGLKKELESIKPLNKKYPLDQLWNN